MTEPIGEEQERIAAYASDAVNRVAKWRTVFTGWQLGTRALGDPEGDAVRDAWERLILLRLEVTALTGLLIKKEVITAAELTEQLAIEAEALEVMYEKAWPGFVATLNGMNMKLPEAAETMRRRNFKP